MIRSDDVKEQVTKVRETAGHLRDRRRRTRRRLEEIFSRDVLGSVLVSVAAGKVVEQIIVMAAPGRPARLIAWFVAFWAFVYLFVKWEAVAKKALDAAEAVESPAEG